MVFFFILTAPKKKGQSLTIRPPVTRKVNRPIYTVMFRFQKKSTIHKTDFGTFIVNGIEYNEFPAPCSLTKATESQWAIMLRDEGRIRLSSIGYYQNYENPELGPGSVKKHL